MYHGLSYEYVVLHTAAFGVDKSVRVLAMAQHVVPTYELELSMSLVGFRVAPRFRQHRVDPDLIHVRMPDLWDGQHDGTAISMWPWVSREQP